MAPTPINRLIGSYFLLTTIALIFPGRPAFWPALLALHLLLAVILLSQTWRRSLLRWARLPWPEVERAIRLWYPLMFLPLIYWEIPLLNQAIYQGSYFDPLVIDWEQTLFDSMPSQTWDDFAPYLWLSELLHAAYLSYYAIIAIPPLILFFQRRDEAMQFDIFVVMLVSLLHCLTFIFFPVQGPRYLFPAPEGGNIEAGLLYGLTHSVLEAGSSRGAAFPSAHVAVSFAQTVVLFYVRPLWGWPLLVLSLLLAISTVYGGFHYLVDAVAGGVVGLGLALLAVQRWPLAARPVTQPQTKSSASSP